MVVVAVVVEITQTIDMYHSTWLLQKNDKREKRKFYNIENLVIGTLTPTTTFESIVVISES